MHLDHERLSTRRKAVHQHELPHRARPVELGGRQVGAEPLEVRLIAGLRQLVDVDVRREVGRHLDPVRAIETSGHGHQTTSQEVEVGKPMRNQVDELVELEPLRGRIQSDDTHAL